MASRNCPSFILALACSLCLSACAATDGITAGPMGDAFANAMGIPQVDAFLPYAAQVPATGRLPIDGDWTVSTIGKTIRIEGGRAVAVDPWTHAMALKVRPNMVVMRDIKQVSDRRYTAFNLPIPGETDMIVQSDGTIAVTVNGIPRYEFVLIPEKTSAAATQPLPTQPPPTPVESDRSNEPINTEQNPETCTLELDRESESYVCVED